MDDKRIQGPLSLHSSFWHVNPSIIGRCSVQLSTRRHQAAVGVHGVSICPQKDLRQVAVKGCVQITTYIILVFLEAPPPTPIPHPYCHQLSYLGPPCPGRTHYTVIFSVHPSPTGILKGWAIGLTDIIDYHNRLLKGKLYLTLLKIRWPSLHSRSFVLASRALHFVLFVCLLSLWCDSSPIIWWYDRNYRTKFYYIIQY